MYKNRKLRRKSKLSGVKMYNIHQKIKFVLNMLNSVIRSININY